MRLRSSALQRYTLAIVLGAVASSALAISRPVLRSPVRQPVPAPAPTPAPAVDSAARPTPRPLPRTTESFITIDRVRYRVTCTVTRYIGGIAMEDGTVPVWTTVSLNLRRADGRMLTAPAILPQLTIAQGGESTAINLTPLPTMLPSSQLIFTGSGSNSWTDDVQLTGRLTVPQRRGAPATTTIRTIPFTLIPLP